MGSGAFLVETCRQLGDELIKAWYAHGGVESGEGRVEGDENSVQNSPHSTHHYPPVIPPDEDEVLYARRLVAQRCLYGVDKNFMAVDLAKLALWLVTLARDHAFTFLDHALRHGDSLVGLSREQIIGFHWEPKKQKKFGEDLIQRRLDRATEARAKILNAREDVAYRDQEQKMALAEEALSGIRLLGDACVSAFFAGKKKKEREDRVDQLFGIASAYLEKLKEGKLDHELRKSLEAAATSLQEGEHPIPAFHWEIEFPEVFSRENGGFDAFVGNPPFAGHITLASCHRDFYTDYLREQHQGSGGKCDLVAFFFRQTFTNIRVGGTLGLIGTNTIRQGATRASGLGAICKSGGSIFNVTRRLRWPGVAAVVVSIVHIAKRLEIAGKLVDGRAVERITSFLFSVGPETDPQPLRSEGVYCLQGAVLRGSGFVFADGKQPPNTREDLSRILDSDSKYADVCRPIVNTSDIYGEAAVDTSKIAIDFGEMSFEAASSYPLFMEVLRETVAKERTKSQAKSSGAAAASKYWEYSHPASQLFEVARRLDRVIAIAKTSETQAFVFVDPNWLLSQSLIVFPDDSISLLGVLQSRCHLEWASFFSSSFKDDARYTPSECLVTFPFPVSWRENQSLEEAASVFLDHRDRTKVNLNEGLTDIFNRFHNRDERDAGILKLRELHDAMDRAVLRAHGWDDLAETARCEFLLDYEEEENDAPGAKKSKKKKPWRLRWPDEFRDEVLARLLELNEQRHKEELLLAKSKKSEEKPTPVTKRVTRQTEDDSSQTELF
ncbi:Eco57I restriction-modification methylase domain-containing protein [Stieleria tagensis]|uniref:Eco57I restriction-modification methylase domain-containing protein n=1 Tax=Stieleria tagensis TaxID=2956795 RepID=UPI0036F24BF2